MWYNLVWVIEYKTEQKKGCLMEKVSCDGSHHTNTNTLVVEGSGRNIKQVVLCLHLNRSASLVLTARTAISEGDECSQKNLSLVQGEVLRSDYASKDAHGTVVAAAKRVLKTRVGLESYPVYFASFLGKCPHHAGYEGCAAVHYHVTLSTSRKDDVCCGDTVAECPWMTPADLWKICTETEHADAFAEGAFSPQKAHIVAHALEMISRRKHVAKWVGLLGRQKAFAQGLLRLADTIEQGQPTLLAS